MGDVNDCKQMIPSVVMSNQSVKSLSFYLLRPFPLLLQVKIFSYQGAEGIWIEQEFMVMS